MRYNSRLDYSYGCNVLEEAISEEGEFYSKSCRYITTVDDLCVVNVRSDLMVILKQIDIIGCFAVAIPNSHKYYIKHMNNVFEQK